MNSYINISIKTSAKYIISYVALGLSVLGLVVSATLSFLNDETHIETECITDFEHSFSLDPLANVKKASEFFKDINESLDIIISLPDSYRTPPDEWTHFINNMSQRAHVRIFTNNNYFTGPSNAEVKYYPFSNISFYANLAIGDSKLMLVVSSWFYLRNNSVLSFAVANRNCKSATSDLMGFFDMIWSNGPYLFHRTAMKQKWIRYQGFMDYHKNATFIYSPYEYYNCNRTNFTEAIFSVLGDNQKTRYMITRKMFNYPIKNYRDSIYIAQITGFFETSVSDYDVDRKIIVPNRPAKGQIDNLKSILCNLRENGSLYVANDFDISGSFVEGDTDTLLLSAPIGNAFSDTNLIFGYLNRGSHHFVKNVMNELIKNYNVTLKKPPTLVFGE
ncbi:hypothetical protein GPJ56_009462 [Histomonas meleagridis]|uniref:uncharacterized protein n=1 Tax=Histomonas meleagridis TaxID=135588 RepID=UPI003559CB0A|nr:hypothetical protein GPJ56_009462 [Histomonas meleagridis]KAH0800327.1 hypothetical protein GO595_006916 [Histomonas meleagridis]